METEYKPEFNKETKLILWIFALWFATVALGTALGLFSAIPFVVPLFIFQVLPIVSYFINPQLRTFLKSFGLVALTAFHIWRIPAAFVWLGYTYDFLPHLFVNLVGWGDFIAGVLALIAVVSPFQNRWAYIGVHIFGALDFLDALLCGMSLQFGVKDLLILNLSSFPIALIPLIGVPTTFLTHIAAFDLLFPRKNKNTNTN